MRSIPHTRPLLVLDFPAVQHGARARVSPALSATNVAGAGCQTGSLATLGIPRLKAEGDLPDMTCRLLMQTGKWDQNHP